MRELGEGIRRMYELMQSNDLSAPEFKCGNNLFSITLSHKFIYSEEERIWLDAFQAFSLTRDERTVVRLGYGGALISPEAIWDSCGIVDTDYYRRLIESLREKGILLRRVESKAAINKATRRRTSKKAIPQFEIAVPQLRKEAPERRIETTMHRDDRMSDTGDYARVYVSNLTFEAQPGELMDVFRSFGEVSDIQMPQHSGSSNNRGYAYVEFESLSVAKEVASKSGQIRLRGRPIRVELANPPAIRRNSRDTEVPGDSVRSADPRKVFIANLPAKVKEEALLEVLSRYGTVLELHMRDPNTGESHNYAFVTFAQSGSAAQALEQSGKIVLGGRVLYLQEYSQKLGPKTKPRIRQTPITRPPAPQDSERYSQAN